MAFKLTAKQSSRLMELVNAAKAKAEALEEALGAFNTKTEELFEPVEQAAEALNEAQAELKSFLEEAAADWRSELEGKSERWQESEKGEAATAFIEEWEQWAEMDEILIDPPEPLEVEIPDFDEHPSEG